MDLSTLRAKLAARIKLREDARARQKWARERFNKAGKDVKLNRGAISVLRSYIKKLLGQRSAPVVMYDAVTVANIPADAEAVAGYKDGNYQTWNEILKRFPKARHLSINVFASDISADCLDVESGDATNGEAPGWFKARRKARPTARKATFYTSVSNADPLVAVLKANGIQRSEYILWTAHYGDGKHICGPTTCRLCVSQADGTQYTDSGGKLDVSYLSKDFFA